MIKTARIFSQVRTAAVHPTLRVMTENTSIFSKVRAILGVPYC